MKSEVRRRDDGQERIGRVADRLAGGGQGGRVRDVGRHLRARASSRSSASSTRIRPTWPNSVWRRRVSRSSSRPRASRRDICYIGEKTPTGANLYARRDDDKRVFLIARLSGVDAQPVDVRPARQDAHRARARQGAGRRPHLRRQDCRAAKKDNEWRITTPINARADYSASEGDPRAGRDGPDEIDRRRERRAGRSQEVRSRQAAAQRLGQPRRARRHVIAFGGKADDGGLYARDVSKPMVVTVENSLADDFKKRRRRLPSPRRVRVPRLQREARRNHLERQDHRLRAGAQRGRQAGHLEARSPRRDDADKSKVETLLTGLADIRATSFKDSTAGTGLDAPAMTV